MIGVIADDLSGAAELGAVGLRHGLRSEIFLGGEISGRADLVCLDTNSRSLGAEEAGERAQSAAKLLNDAGARWIYKKVDSVLRGNVAVELEALMRTLGVPQTLLVPANPSLGRVIRAGRYFVRGQPVNETEFARDPEYPRLSSSVRELLGTQCALPIYICKSDAALPASGIIVGEAQTADDLRSWAARVKPGMLVAGAAEFFGTLLAAGNLAPVLEAPSPPEATGRPELFVCGSTSESSRKFIQSARQNGTPVFSLPKNLAQGASFSPMAVEALARAVADTLQKQPRVILCIDLPLIQDANIARHLTKHLVSVAARAIRSSMIGHIYAEGGATAAALVREMGWQRLTVTREMALGVATVAVENEKSLRFTLKPGTYGWPDEVCYGRGKGVLKIRVSD
ncbi:MAG: hypothetical protein JWQ04_259 [Pedosphaera sp.]|nr:hypothetical protein [Pedosphaera sp.]